MLQHHDVELRNMLVSHKYDQSRKSPLVFTGKFGRDGFIFMKFVDNEDSGKKKRLFSSLVSMIGSNDNRKGGNFINNTQVDFEEFYRRSGFSPEDCGCAG